MAADSYCRARVAFGVVGPTRHQVDTAGKGDPDALHGEMQGRCHRADFTAVKEELMSSGAARWTLAHLDGWTWLVAEYRAWLITLVTVIGLAVPLLVTARKQLPRPAPALVIRSGATALAFSAAMVTICSLLHFSDLRWLAPSQRTSAHLSAPGGLFGFAKPIVSAINSIAGIPVEYRATQVSVHTAIFCAFLALVAFFLVAITWRRARRADIRQIVQEEIRRSTATYARELRSGAN
jgi:hypothetical protein